MKVRKAFRYRCYPTPAQADTLTWALDRCRELYNAGLEERREAYRMCGVSVGYLQQQNQLPTIKEDRPEYKQIGSQRTKEGVHERRNERGGCRGHRA